MELQHTNKIAVDILSKEFPDYTLNRWHYDREYLMILRAIERRALVQVPEWTPKQPKTTTITTDATTDINNLGRWVFVMPDESTGIEKQITGINENKTESPIQLYTISLYDEFEGSSIGLYFTSRIYWNEGNFMHVVNTVMAEAINEYANSNPDSESYVDFDELTDFIKNRMVETYHFVPVEWKCYYSKTFQNVQKMLVNIRNKK